MTLLAGAPSGGVAIRQDPVLGYNFVIGLLDSSSSPASLAVSALMNIATGGFSECSGLELTMQPEEYKEGGNNGATLKFPSRITWSNIILKRGVRADTSLWDWHYSYVIGAGMRRDGFIALLNELHAPNTIWYFQRGLPVKYTGPTMNAGQSNVAIEAIEIAHEGLFQLPGIGVTAAVTAAGGASASVSAGIGVSASVNVGVGGVSVNASLSF